jgi:hypothetical protein
MKASGLSKKLAAQLLSSRSGIERVLDMSEMQVKIPLNLSVFLTWAELWPLRLLLERTGRLVL